MKKPSNHRGAAIEASPAFPPKGGNELSAPAAVPHFASLRRRIIWQLAAVLGISVVLGFTFNAASPVGVRFSGTTSESSAGTTRITNAIPATPAVTATNRVVTLPPVPTPKVERHVAAQTTNLLPAPTAISRPTAATPPQPLVTTPFPATPTPIAEPNPAPIHWAQARTLVAAGQAVLVDVRAKGMYDAGHIPNAISLPETSSPEEFAAFLNNHATNLTLIVYCSSTSCSQSARVATRLVTQYQRPSVKYMTGGYLEYQQEQARNPAGPTP